MYIFGAVLIGFIAAVLSGMFGIGGAGVSTPAIRIFLDATPAIALGTTLPVTIPTAAAGAYTYFRNGLIQRRVAGYCCLGGIFGAAGGALLTAVINLHYLMLLTGAMVLYVSFATVRRGITGRGIETEPAETPSLAHGEPGEPGAPGPGGARKEGPAASGGGGLSQSAESRVNAGAWELAAIGLAAGLFSGLLGVGGGTVMIPAFVYLLKMSIKASFGTSLAVIAVIAVPGSVVHYFLHHVSWPLALYLTAGSVLGATLGARITVRASERVIYVLFGILLAAFGIVFIMNEVISMVR